MSGLATLAGLALLLGANPRAQLKALQERKSAEEAAAQALLAREGSLLEAIEAAEQSWRDAAEAARRAEEERAASEKRLERARDEEAKALGDLAERRSELAPRLLARAREGRFSDLVLVMTSPSLPELVKRLYLWEKVTTHDLTLLREANAALATTLKARAARESEAKHYAALAKEAASRRDVAAALRDEHRTLLSAIRNARSLHERAAAEAAGQETKLAEFVSALPASSGSEEYHGAFGELRGKLPHPVAGTVEVGFGRVVNPLFNTITVQKGLDIRAPAGSEVRAVAPGRVAHAGWFKGYGNLVIVDHGDGYHTLVAHLASMSTAMGEEVDAGTLLGTVGDTGSLKGAYLYFEIRERGRPVDPRIWLRP